MLNLTGPAALDIRAMAEILGRVRGRPLFLKIVPLEEYASRLTCAGKSADFARQWGTTYLGMDRGEFGKVDPLLTSLLGRPLHTIGELLARDRSAVDLNR
jgi:hypothetical protein